MEHLSGGTPSSSTYFKGNPRSNPHQLYMTVKKATPVKNQDLPTVDHIPREYPLIFMAAILASAQHAIPIFVLFLIYRIC